MTDIVQTLYGAEFPEAQEKLAQARFIEKLAGEYQIDLTGLTPEQRLEYDQLVMQDLSAAGLAETEKTAQAGASYAAMEGGAAKAFAEAAYAEFKKLAEENLPGHSTAPADHMPGWLSRLVGQAKPKGHLATDPNFKEKLGEAPAEENLTLDDAVTLRALEMMDGEGYDTDKVVEKLAQYAAAK